MHRQAYSVGATLALCAAIAWSCGPRVAQELPPDAAERYARAYCKAVFECDCPYTIFETEQECFEDHRFGLQRFIDFGESRGMEPDVDCYESKLEVLEETPCAEWESNVKYRCELFKRGDEAKPVGSPCEHHSRFGFVIHECAGSRPYCDHRAPEARASGVCRDFDDEGIPEVVGLGEPCTTWNTNCAGEELYCDDLGTLTCQPIVGEGESCLWLTACNEGNLWPYTHYCKDEFWGNGGICTPRIPPGGACDFRDAGPCGQRCEDDSEPLSCVAYDCIDGICQPSSQNLVCRTEEARMWFEERAKVAG